MKQRLQFFLKWRPHRLHRLYLQLLKLRRLLSLVLLVLLSGRTRTTSRKH